MRLEDGDTILVEAAPMIETYHLDHDEPRAITGNEHPGGHPFPLGRG